MVSGSIAIDRIMSFSGTYKDALHADNLDSVSVSVFLDELKDTRGGIGANIAYSLALLGEKPVLIGSVGPNGQEYMDSLKDTGVDVSHVYESKLPTASFSVITDADQNQIGGFYPGAMFDSDALSFEPWKDNDAIFVVSPQDPKAMDRLVAQCKDLNLRLFYDAGQQVTNIDGDYLKHGVDAAELLILNEYEFGLLCKKADTTIEDVKAHVPVVVTTYGKLGSVIEGKDVPEPIKVGAADVEKAADPTGAGDAYRAGFLYGYMRDWPLKTCGQLGAVCAAYAVENFGTQTHTFTRDDVENRYQQAFNETIEL